MKFADNLKRELPRIPFAPPLPADGRRGEARLALDPTRGDRDPADDRRGEARLALDPTGGDRDPADGRRGEARLALDPTRGDRDSADGRRGEARLALDPTGGNRDSTVSGDGTQGGACPAPTDARHAARTGKGTKGGACPAPTSSGFRAFAAAGKKLAALHLDYEQLKPYELEQVETPGVPLSWKVEDKMRLNREKTMLTVNPSLSLAGIPPKVYEYRLGNRSALEWVIDQYQVYTDKRSGIVSDPNREDDPEYIVRLVGQVVRVSLETVDIVAGLPAEFAEAAEEKT